MDNTEFLGLPKSENKKDNEKTEGQMIPITSQAKLEKVFLDICGPFPAVGVDTDTSI